MSFGYNEQQAIDDKILIPCHRNIILGNCELCGKIGKYMWKCEDCGKQYDEETKVDFRYPRFIPFLTNHEINRMMWNPNIIATIYGWEPKDSHTKCRDPGNIVRYWHKDAKVDASGMNHHWIRHHTSNIKTAYDAIHDHYWKKFNGKKKKRLKTGR